MMSTSGDYVAAKSVGKRPLWRITYFVRGPMFLNMQSEMQQVDYFQNPSLSSVITSIESRQDFARIELAERVAEDVLS